jgi:TPM domain
MSKLAWRINTSALLFVLLLGGYFWYTFKRPPAVVMPASGLLNQSSNHKYDRALRASIRAFEKRTQVQLGIIMQNRLPAGVSIEEQAVHSFKNLRMGEQEQHQAILLIWSEQEHLFKVEVGEQLKPAFPDALCRRVEQAARAFMLSNTPFAQRDFLTEMINSLGLHYLDYKKSGLAGQLQLPTPNNNHALTRYFSVKGEIGRGYAASAEQVRRELPPLVPELAREMQPDKVLATVLQRYLQSLQQGLGTPQLPLLTEGSRFYRIERPRSAAWLQGMYRVYQNAMPWQIVQQGPLAAAVFRSNAQTNKETNAPAPAPQPILLRQNERGQWLVDEAKTAAYWHLLDDGSSSPKFQGGPYAFAWPSSQAHYQNRAHLPALIDKPLQLIKTIGQAEAAIARQPEQAENWIKLAELLQFEMVWLEAAAPLYEKALQLAPQRHDLAWRLIDIYHDTTDINGMERHYLALLKKTPEDALLQSHYKSFQKKYEPDHTQP